MGLVVCHRPGKGQHGQPQSSGGCYMLDVYTKYEDTIGSNAAQTQQINILKQNNFH